MSRFPLSDAGERTLQQLWGPAVASGAYRLSPLHRDGWDTLRAFTVAPSPRNVRMFIEDAPRRATLRSLTTYSGLRTPRVQAARHGMAVTLVSPGVRSYLSSIYLQRASQSRSAEQEPLTVAGSTFESDFFCHLGVRAGANSKPTAQLFNLAGVPLGYAKFSWDSRTARDVSAEAERMQALQGRSGAFRTPRVLSLGASFGRPFVITEPLPSRVKQLHHPTDLSVGDLCNIAPRTRVDLPQSSLGLRLLHDRARALVRATSVRAPAEGLMRLIEQTRSTSTRLPFVAYDHGDLVPWNACVDDSGQPWLWDWESSIEDLPAGTDVIHWFVHSVHGASPSDLPGAIDDAFTRAMPTFKALGMSRRGAHISAATYVCLAVERACSLAQSNDTWETNRVGRQTVGRLLALGEQHAARALP